jgi:hypothetical protein
MAGGASQPSIIPATGASRRAVSIPFWGTPGLGTEVRAVLLEERNGVLGLLLGEAPRGQRLTQGADESRSRHGHDIVTVLRP